MKPDKRNYQTLRQSYLLQKKEEYVPPVTLSYPAWRDYVASGYNTLYGDAIVPGGTEDDGAVYSGHVRQNPFTAGQML